MQVSKHMKSVLAALTTENYKVADCIFHVTQWYSAKHVWLGLFEKVFGVKKLVSFSCKTF